MNAQQLSKRLETAGCVASRVCEPSLEEDGLIQISANVHVQVPFDSEYGANVVRETSDGQFVFNEPRRAFDDLVTDLRCALRDETAELSA